MRRIFVKTLALSIGAWLLCGAAACAQEPAELPPNPEVERQELVNLELENPRAIKLHNPTFFKAAYSDDFHGISRYGEIVNKQGIVRELETIDRKSVV